VRKLEEFPEVGNQAHEHNCDINYQRNSGDGKCYIKWANRSPKIIGGTAG